MIASDIVSLSSGYKVAVLKDSKGILSKLKEQQTDSAGKGNNTNLDRIKLPMIGGKDDTGDDDHLLVVKCYSVSKDDILVVLYS